MSVLNSAYGETKKALSDKSAELDTAKKSSQELEHSLRQQIADLTTQNKVLQNAAADAEQIRTELARTKEAEKQAVSAKKIHEGKIRALTLKNEALEGEMEQTMTSLDQTKEALQNAKDYAAKLETDNR